MATVVERVGRLDGTAAYIFKFNGLPGNLYQYDLWSSHHDMVCVQAAATDCETAPQQHKRSHAIASADDADDGDGEQRSPVRRNKRLRFGSPSLAGGLAGGWVGKVSR